MQVSTEKKDSVKQLITVTVPVEDVKKVYNDVLRGYAKNAKIDGFRKGHIPTKVLMQHFEFDILGNAQEKLVNNFYGKAIEESKLDVVGYPQVKIKDQVKSAEELLEKDFVFELEAEVSPEIEIKPFEELKVKNLKSEVTDADVDQMIETLRKQQGKWQVKDDLTVGDGTLAKIDFVGRVDGAEFEGGKAENFSLTVGKTQMIPGFTEQIVGHKAGDKFTINVKFPDDYQAENLKGKNAEFDITVNSVSEQILPEVNADFIKAFGVKDGTLDSFKVELRKNMERELARALYQKQRDNLFKALAAQYGEFAVPQVFVAAETDRLRKNMEQNLRMYGMKKIPEGLVKDEMFHDEAVKSARIGAIVRALIKFLNNEEPSEEAVNKQLNAIAGAYEDPAEVIKQIRADKKEFANVKNVAVEAEIIEKIYAKAADGEEHLSFNELVSQRQ